MSWTPRVGDPVRYTPAAGTWTRAVVAVTEGTEPVVVFDSGRRSRIPRHSLELLIEPGQWWEHTKSGIQYVLEEVAGALHPGNGRAGGMQLRRLDRTDLYCGAIVTPAAMEQLLASGDWKYVPRDTSYKERLPPDSTEPSAVAPGPDQATKQPQAGQFWRRGRTVVELLEQAHIEDASAWLWRARVVADANWGERRVGEACTCDLREWSPLTADEQQGVWSRVTRLLDDLNDHALGCGSASMPGGIARKGAESGSRRAIRTEALGAALAEGRLRLREADHPKLELDLHASAIWLLTQEPMTVGATLSGLTNGTCRLSMADSKLLAQTVLGRLLREGRPESAPVAAWAKVIDGHSAAVPAAANATAEQPKKAERVDREPILGSTASVRWAPGTAAWEDPPPLPGRFWRRGEAVVELLKRVNGEDESDGLWLTRYIASRYGDVSMIGRNVVIDVDGEWTPLTPDEQRDVWQTTVKLLDDLNEYVLGRGSASMPTVHDSSGAPRSPRAMEAALAEGRLRLREAGYSEAVLDAKCDWTRGVLRRSGNQTVNEVTAALTVCDDWTSVRHEESWVRTVLGRYLRESLPGLAKAAGLACGIGAARPSASSANDAAIRFEAAGVARTPEVGDVYTRGGVHVRLVKRLDDGRWEGETEDARVTGSAEVGFDVDLFGRPVVIVLNGCSSVGSGVLACWPPQRFRTHLPACSRRQARSC